MKKITKRFLYLTIVLCALISAFSVSVFATSTDSSKSSIPALKIEASNLSFEDAVYVLYAVSHDGIEATDIKLLFWTEAQESLDAYTVGTESYSKTYVSDNVTVNNTSCAIFKNNELRAKNMADYVYARAYANVDGIEYYSEVSKYSILQYAYNKLGYTGTESTNTALKNMLKSMLQYGADAQIYANYNTDRLSNEQYYQIQVEGGTLEDGFTKGLYHAGETATLTAPEKDGELLFEGWQNSLGEIVFTDCTVNVKNLEKNETFIAKMSKNCPHLNTVTIYGKSATCTEDGISNGEMCLSCGEMVVAQKTVAALGHTERTIDSISATCTEPGLSEGKYCTVCNVITVEQVKIEALGHNYSDYVCTVCNKEMSGLYDSNGNLVASWKELTDDYGLDITRDDYTINNVKSISSSPYMVLSNYTELAAGTKLVIDDSIQHITNMVFSYCSKLTEVVIPNSVSTIGMWAFHDCALSSINIPESVISIDVGAFDGLRNLKRVYISDIAAWCQIDFLNSGSSSSPGSNPLCPGGADLYLNGEIVTDLIIPQGITKIKDNAFYGAKSIQRVVIPDSVVEIGNSAFAECNSLSNVEISDNLTIIGTSAFNWCDNLNFNEFNNAYYIGSNSNPYHILYKAKSKDITTCVIRNNTAVIAGGAFEDCTNIETIEIQNSIVSICTAAFSGCTKLENIFFEDVSKLTVIDDSAFYNCSALTDITIPVSVTSIGKYAFYNCTGLKNIIIPEGVTSIGYEAFYNCSALTDITIPGSVTSIGNYAFYNCTSLKNIAIPEGLTSISGGMFYNCSALTDITIPASVTSIGASAFSGCTGLKNIIIPEGVTSISGSMFYNCSALTDITIPASVTSIGSSAFSDCTGLKNIIIPEGVTSIGYAAFRNCSALTGITIPGSVTSIDRFAFSGCTSLTSVTFENPDGWCYASRLSDTNGTSISAVDISNTSTAAEYLTDTYYKYCLKRS